MGNVMTVENWVNSYQLAKEASAPPREPAPPPEAGREPLPPKHARFYPRLEELQDMLLANKQINSIEQSPLINPVTKKAEWPIEEPRPIKNYRSLSTDRSSVIGKGVVQFIPFYSEDNDEVMCGYLIRAGDPETGKVLCSDGVPYVRGSP